MLLFQSNYVRSVIKLGGEGNFGGVRRVDGRRERKVCNWAGNSDEELIRQEKWKKNILYIT